MKIQRFVCALAFVFTLLTSGYSLDFSAGVMGWYAWWQPHFEDEMRGVNNPLKASDPANFGEAYNDQFSFDPAFLVGPVANLRFLDNWSLGVVFLVSSDFSGDASYQVDRTGPIIFYTKADFTIKRNDADCTLTYRFNQFFGLFVGYKYSRYEGTGNFQYTYLTTTEYFNIERVGTMHGPGLGINVMIPLVNKFFISSSFSVLSMKAEWTYRSTKKSTMVTTETTLNPDLRGFNLLAGLGYYFSSFTTTLLVGGRYQYLVDIDDSSRVDKFYGLIVSAIYAF